MMRFDSEDYRAINPDDYSDEDVRNALGLNKDTDLDESPEGLVGTWRQAYLTAEELHARFMNEEQTKKETW